jgi:ABC-type dipeptide/oligopeptide/nickel transport system permease component
MGNYLLRRLIIALPSLIGISLILFVLLALAPGDPFGELAANPNIPPEVREALRIKFGIDDPVLIRYLRWLVAMLHGDWGFSFASRIDVDQLILQRIPTTLYVVGSAQLVALAVALPVGVYAAVVTLVALQMPSVFGGAIVTEQIFRIPGIGSLLISAILANDTPVIMAVTFVFACLVILFNLLADIIYGWLDPRISYR